MTTTDMTKTFKVLLGVVVVFALLKECSLPALLRVQRPN